MLKRAEVYTSIKNCVCDIGVVEVLTHMVEKEVENYLLFSTIDINLNTFLKAWILGRNEYLLSIIHLNKNLFIDTKSAILKLKIALETTTI
jgi:hypothetical protein